MEVCFLKFLNKRSTVKDNFQTPYVYDETTFEESTVGINPTKSTTKGTFLF